ncbi:hypothetical protein N9Z27_01330 [Alphaproteobacteria bacterium]|nr:hypothetical protein [Alphaproteobacteria bacterium]
MGFCLFESAQKRGTYFAVNPQYVDDIELKIKSDEGLAVCLLHLSVDVAPFAPLAVGQKDEIRDVVMQALQIPLGKVDLNVLTGQDHQGQMPLLLNQPGRIAIVHEMLLDDVGGTDSVASTASRMLFADGKARVIVQRPAIFVQMVNVGDEIPAIGEALL